MTGFLAWLRGGRPFPYPRHTAGSAMAMLYFAGGLTTLLILLLPHPATLDIGVMLVIGGVAPLVSLAILRLRFRLATSAYHGCWSSGPESSRYSWRRPAAGRTRGPSASFT